MTVQETLFHTLVICDSELVQIYIKMDILCESNECQLTLYLTVSILAIICNIVVLIGMIGSRLWTRNQHLLIINLCVCDLLCTTWWTVATIVLYSPAGLYNQDSLDVEHCMVSTMDRVYCTIQMSTVLTIIIMAIDHYVAIVLPLRYKVILSRRRIVACIITVWVISVVICFITIAFTLARLALLKNEEDIAWNPCVPHGYTKFIMFFLLTLVSVAIFIMVYVYIRVLIEIRKSAAFMRNMIGQSQSHDNKKNHHAVVTTLLVLLTFIIGWVPYMTSYFIYLNFSIVQTMLILNALYDPLIYAIRLTQVRQSIKQVFFSIKCNQEVQ